MANPYEQIQEEKTVNTSPLGLGDRVAIGTMNLKAQQTYLEKKFGRGNVRIRPSTGFSISEDKWDIYDKSMGAWRPSDEKGWSGGDIAEMVAPAITNTISIPTALASKIPLPWVMLAGAGIAGGAELTRQEIGNYIAGESVKNVNWGQVKGIAAFGGLSVGVSKALANRTADRALARQTQTAYETTQAVAQEYADTLHGVNERVGNVLLRKYPEVVGGALKTGAILHPGSRALKKVAVPVAETIAKAPEAGTSLLEQVIKAPRGQMAAEWWGAADDMANAIFDLPTKKLAREGFSPNDPLFKMVSRGGEEFGRSLNIMKEYHLPPAMRTQLVAKFAEVEEELIKTGAPKEIKETARTIKDALLKGALPDSIDWIVEYATSMKLWNPLTHLRNVTGNTLATMFRLTEKAVTPIPDAVLWIVNPKRALSGGKRERYFGEVTADIYGMIKGLTHSGTEMARDMAQISDATRTMETGVGEAIGGPFGKVMRVPFQALDAMDKFFKNFRQFGEGYGLAYREGAKKGLKGRELWDFIESFAQENIKFAKLSYDPRARMLAQELFKPTTKDIYGVGAQKPWESIRKGAEESLFQTDLDTTWATLNAARSTDYGRLIKLFLPFLRTPVNVAKFSLRRMPGMGMLMPSSLSALKTGGGEAADVLARQAVGGIIAATAVWFAMEGKIIGPAHGTQSKKELQYATGAQPQSIVVGDKYISYRGYEPLASFFNNAALLAEAYKAHKEGNLDEKAGELVSTFMKSAIDQPYLMGISNAFDMMRGEPAGSRQFWTSALSGSLFPTPLLSQINKTMDPVIRQSESDERLKFKPIKTPLGTTPNIDTPTFGIREDVTGKWPYYSKTVPAKIDVLGQESRLSENPWFRFFGLSEKRKGPVADVARELLKYEVDIPIPTKTVPLEGHPEFKAGRMTDVEYRNFKKERGKIIIRTVSNTINNKAYKLSDDRHKRAMLIMAVEKAVSYKGLSKLKRKATERAIEYEGKYFPDIKKTINYVPVQDGEPEEENPFIYIEEE